MATSARKNGAGSGENPRSPLSGEYGSSAPRRTTAKTATVNARDGRLRRKGTRRVRMANTISVCVARDSMNHPDRNSGGAAWKTDSMIQNVAKSKIDEMG